MKQRSQFLEGWLASEQASHDVISVKRAYIDINDGNLHDGLLFSQIMYWHGANKETGKPRLTVTRDGELWLVKSYDEWWEECRINKHTARQCLSRMAERGLIVMNLWKFNGAPTIHLRINWDVFEHKVKSIRYDISNPIDTTPQNQDLIQDVKSITDTTADTTADKIAPNGDSPSSVKPKRITPHYEHYLALVAAFGFNEPTMPKRAKTNFMSVAVNLHASQFPVHYIPDLHRFVSKLAKDNDWGKEWTVNALEKYVPQFMKHLTDVAPITPVLALDDTELETIRANSMSRFSHMRQDVNHEQR